MSDSVKMWLPYMMAPGLTAGFGRYALPQPVKRSKSRVSLGKMLRLCPGGRHAWFESNCGPVRKQVVVQEEPAAPAVAESSS